LARSRPPGGVPESTGSHPAFFPETGEVRLPRYDRRALPAGAVVEGPAMIEDDSSTTVVYPGQRAAADDAGNLVIEAVA
jgi:N-methylhydantoinase A